MKFIELRSKKSFPFVLLFIFVILISFSSSPTVANTDSKYFPGEHWDVTTPEEQGTDSNVISSLYGYISGQYLQIHSILLLRNGYIIDENYLHDSQIYEANQYHSADRFWSYQTFEVENIRDNRLHALWSCTKSVTSLLIGIAIDEGYFTVNQTFFEIFPDRWKASYGNETKKNITIEHLLTMRAGLSWDEETDAFDYWPASNYSIDYILNKSLAHNPGETFTYSTGYTQLLSEVLQNKTGMKMSEFAREKLFAPIGINDTEWWWYETEWEWGSGNISFGGFGIYMTPRAMARIGLLCLNNGSWNDKQIVSEEWISTATSNFVGDPGYGYLFWTTDNSFFAAGFLGQRIFVIPEHSIVAVFTAAEFRDLADYYDHIVNNFIIGATSTSTDGTSTDSSSTDTSSNGTAGLEILPFLAAIVVLSSWYRRN